MSLYLCLDSEVTLPMTSEFFYHLVLSDSYLFGAIAQLTELLVYAWWLEKCLMYQEFV